MPATGVASAHAQQPCNTIDPPCEVPALAITVHPYGDTARSAPVTIDFNVANVGAGALSASATLDGIAISTLAWQRVGNGGDVSGWVEVSPTTNGTHSIEVAFCESGRSPGCVSGSTTLIYKAPPPPQPHSAPVIDMSRNPGDVRDPSKCVADCFENAFTYAMPGYVSRGVERGVTLVYRSGQARPVATVALTVADLSSTPATKFSLKLERPNGSLVTFLNGRDSLFFAGPGDMVGQFLAADGGTRRVNYTAVVTAYWPDEIKVTTAPAPVLIVNEATSPFGAGVTIAGLQHVYANYDGVGVVVTDGSGGASYFSGSCTVASTCTFTSPVGDFSTLSTDGAMYRRRYPDGTWVIFNADGLHYQTVDRFGNVTNYDYGWNSDYQRYVPIRITDPIGKVTTLQYRDINYLHNGAYNVGSLGWITDPGGRLAAPGISPSNNLIELADVDGTNLMSITYDAVHRPWQLQDHNNGLWTFTYASNGTLSQIQAPLADLGGGVQQRPTTTLVGPGAAVTNAAQSAPDTPVPASLDRRASVTDPRGNPTYYTLNRFGSPLDVADALGWLDSTAYNGDGLPWRTTPVGGAATYLTWVGPRLTSVSKGNSTINYDYEPTFNQVDSIWGSTATQRFTYDLTKPGYPLSTSRVGRTPEDSATRYLFTADGRIQSVTDPLGDATTWTYEPTGFQNVAQVNAVTTSGEKRTTFGYDALGWTTSVTDPTGATSQTVYDTHNRVSNTVGPRADTTHVDYDGLGNVTQVIDARHQTFGFGRNVLGWVLTQTDPTGAAESFAYNVNGSVRRHTNRRGQTDTTAYDARGRVQSVHQQAEGQTTTYAYDPNGLWTAVSNGVSTDTVKLNRKFLVAEQITARGGFTRSVRASYDLDQQRTGINVLRNGVPSDSVAYGYGAAGQLTSIADPLGNLTIIGYNSDLLPNSYAYAGGVVVTNLYSKTHGLTRTSFNVPAINQAFGRMYRYDSLTRIREISDTANKRWRFTYDQAGELASDRVSQGSTTALCHMDPDYGRVCNPTSETLLSSRSYTYDPVGNPTDAGVVTSWGNRLARLGGDTITYDLDGNIVRRWRIGLPATFDQILTWNSLGQLTQVVTGRSGITTVAQYWYDGFGRRAAKQVNGGPIVHSIWDGDQVVAETSASGDDYRFYTYYPGIDRLHSVTENGVPNYAASDASGNVIGLFDGSFNQVSDQYAYQPFGVMDRNDHVTSSPIRWKGLQYDEETGLYYVRARYYAPELGRFIAEDPIGLQGGVNPYAYAGNDPVNFSDPSGTDCTNAEALKITYTRNEDGDWVETRTCPAGMGMGGITVIGQLPSGLVPSTPRGPTGPTGPTSPPTGPSTPSGPGMGPSQTSPTTAAPPKTGPFHGPSCSASAFSANLANGALVGSVVGGTYGTLVGASAGRVGGGALGGFIGTLAGAPTIIGAPLAAYAGTLGGGIAGAWAGAIVGVHAGAYAGAGLGMTTAGLATGVLCAVGR